MAPWCPACRSFQTTWQSLAEWSRDLDINVGVVDVTENPGMFRLDGVITLTVTELNTTISHQCTNRAWFTISHQCTDLAWFTISHQCTDLAWFTISHQCTDLAWLTTFAQLCWISLLSVLSCFRDVRLRVRHNLYYNL